MEITPKTGTAQLGDQLQFKAVAKDAAGNVLDMKATAWFAAPFDAATADLNGLVHFTSPGEITVGAVFGEEAGFAKVMVASDPVARLEIMAPKGALAVGGVIATLFSPVYSVRWPQRINVEYVVDVDADAARAHWWVQSASLRLPDAMAAAASFDSIPRARFSGSPSLGFMADAPLSTLAPPELTQVSAAVSAGGVAAEGAALQGHRAVAGVVENPAAAVAGVAADGAALQGHRAQEVEDPAAAAVPSLRRPGDADLQQAKHIPSG